MRGLQHNHPQDNIAVALAGAAHGSETIDSRLLEVDEALPAASIYLQHGPFLQGLGDSDEGGLVMAIWTGKSPNSPRTR